MGLGGNWRRLWAADAISSLGDGAYAAAIPLLAIYFTRSPAQVAGVATAASLPWLLCSLHAGVLADRYDRRRLMSIAQAVQATAVSLAAVVAIIPGGRIWMLYATSFALGAAETVFSNAAQSMLPTVVASEHLEAANGRQYATETVTQQFIGPPLGSLLFAAALPATRSLPFWLDALSFAVSALLIARIRLAPATAAGLATAASAVGSASAAGSAGSAGPLASAGPPSAARPAPRRPMRHDIVEGLHWLLAHRLLRTLAILLAVTNMAGQLAYSTFVLFATQQLHVGTRGFGVLLAASAIGGVAGGLGSRRIVALLGTRRSIILGAAVGAASAAVVGLLARDAYVMVACMAASAFSATVWNVATVSMRQRIIPDRIRGRVNSVYRLAGWGSLPIGAAIGGVIATAFGLRAPWLFAAGLRAGVVVAVVALLRPALFVTDDTDTAATKPLAVAT
ncbi:MAG TPA: MFS transporter [Micromonosporaceae bacterium]|nr:MFS transporter [Micromonosporaceae bacterium]